MKAFVKDPQARIDYTFDWGPWLRTDTITASSWVADSPLTVAIGSETYTDTTTTLYLTGGDEGGDYMVTNHIVTAGGRIDERSMQIKVRQR
jgi:hypothetical protein